MIQAILFDFNGVIINDEPLQMKAYQEALLPEGIALTEEDYYSALGYDDVKFLRATYERAGKPDELTEDKLRELLARKSERHRALVDENNLPLFPGVVTLIKACANNGYTLGVVSMARRPEIDYALGRAGVLDLFSAIVSAEEVTACKPDPQCYRLAFRRADEAHTRRGNHALAPNECLVIEDAPPGVLVARRAGMRVLGVTNTVSAQALRDAGAEVVTPSLADWTTDSIKYVFD